MWGPLSTRWLILGSFHPDKPKDHPNATRHLPICTAGRVIVPVAAQLERKQAACPKTARNHVLLLSVLFYPVRIYKQKQQKHQKHKKVWTKARSPKKCCPRGSRQTKPPRDQPNRLTKDTCPSQQGGSKPRFKHRTRSLPPWAGPSLAAAPVWTKPWI